MSTEGPLVKPKLLVFSANPRHAAPLDLPDEAAKIEEGLEYFRAPIEFRACPATTPDRLFRELLRHEPTYVHFCGHGLGSGELVLVTEDRGEALVTPEALGGLFEHLRDSVQCVVLNACYSRLQAEAIVRHIPFAVGMNTQIEDRDAINFSVVFYEALAKGKDVPKAFGLACSRLQLQSSSGHKPRSRDLIPGWPAAPVGSPRGAHLIPELFQKDDNEPVPDEPGRDSVAVRRPRRISSLESALTALETASRPSLTRAQERLEPFNSDSRGLQDLIKPIVRNDSGPDLRAFLESERPLQLILGDSGYGKSTLLLQLATAGYTEPPTYTLFYDIHQVEQEGSLAGRLAVDLHSSRAGLAAALDNLAKIARSQRGRILILVDAINEARARDPEKFRFEIETLAEELPRQIKLTYSCRKVYWNLYLEGGRVLSKKLYFGSSAFNLKEYSPAESRQAFDQYKEAYNLRGSFSELAVELRDKIRDPLMLRMLSEGYSGSRLPAFAPAVKVFEAYRERFARRFASTHVMSFLDAVIELKARQVIEASGRDYDDQLLERNLLADDHIRQLHFAQLNDVTNPRKPLLLLEDEGVIQSLDDAHTKFRFTYDRLYEYLLGQALGPQLLGERKSVGLATRLDQHLGSPGRSSVAVWQALKSELVRRNLEPNDGSHGLYSRDGLLGLLDRGSGLVDNFARELLRELVFEARPEFADRLQAHLRDDDRWSDLLVDIAPDSPRMLPALADALLSGSRHLARRVSHSLSRFTSPGEVHERFEALLQERLEARFRIEDSDRQGPALRGLIYYSAVIFSLAFKSNSEPVPRLRKLWKMALDAFDGNLANPRRAIAAQFWEVIQQEGHLFVGDEDRVDGMEYIWESLDDQLKSLALRIAQCCANPPPSLHRDLVEIISFFAAKQRTWSLRGRPEQDEVYGYKLEFKIAQWLLIYWSKDRYGEVAQILETLAEKDYWLHIDFALCTMEFVLKHNYADNPSILEDGFEHIKRWTKHFEQDLPDRFYATLSEPDPFTVNYIPVAQLVGIETIFFAPATGPVPALEERFAAADDRTRRLALLAARYLWRGYPEKILGSLKLLLDDNDPEISNWLDRILREIFMVHPRLVERFLIELDVPQERAVRIKHEDTVEDPSGFRYDVDPLMRFLFLGTNRVRRQTIEWYRKLLESNGPQEFLEELVESILPLH